MLVIFKVIKIQKAREIKNLKKLLLAYGIISTRFLKTYFIYVCLSRTFGEVSTEANKMNIVQLRIRILIYVTSYLAYDARNAICLNGRKPQ